MSESPPIEFVFPELRDIEKSSAGVLYRTSTFEIGGQKDKQC
jgi:hypothetical protein